MVIFKKQKLILEKLKENEKEIQSLKKQNKDLGERVKQIEEDLSDKKDTATLMDEYFWGEQK